MAIKTFSRSRSADLTPLANFINANKAGTFLEGFTTNLSESSGAGGVGYAKLQISNDTSKIEIYTPQSSSVTSFFSLTDLTDSEVKYTMSQTNTSYSPQPNYSTYITGAILCKNGLFLLANGTDGNATTLRDRYFAGITVDINGNLTVIVPTGKAVEASVSHSFNVVSTDSANYVPLELYPNFGAPLTSLAPLVVYTSSNNVYLPYAFAATYSQLPGEGLQAVTIGEVNYITNGRFYIKDE